MKKYIAFVLISLIVVGCSGSDATKTNSPTNQNILDPQIRKQKALEHVVNGSIAESKGDYSSAINEFNKTLDYDTSAGICYSLAKNYYTVNKLLGKRIKIFKTFCKTGFYKC